MILERLTISDFRAYRGTHEIDLKPRERQGHHCPIVLFGGLNGAGKTTLLLALKLALYGRLALGAGTSQKSYTEFIRSCIHLMPRAVVQRNSAFVEVEFVHGKLGRQSRYLIRRSWHDDGREIRETATLSEEGVEKKSLSAQSKQGFLNELIPIGVSELFFFDGERIADLATDDSGNALGEAIHRLLGIDLVERLRNDLRVYMLRRENESKDRPGSDELETLRREYEDLTQRIATNKRELAKDKEVLAALTAEKDRIEIKLTERGGEWGVSRQAIRTRAKEVSESIRRDERELREVLAGAYPLSLAAAPLAQCTRQAESHFVALSQREADQVLEEFAAKLKGSLPASGQEIVDELLAQSIRKSIDVEDRFDLSQRSLGRMEHVLQTSIPESKVRTERLANRITQSKDELDQIALQIGQAPDEASLASVFSELASLGEKIAAASADVAVKEREIKTKYGQAIAMARTLRDKHRARSERQTFQKPLQYASGARELLREFGLKSAQQKIGQLEDEFALAFRRLARKEDMITRATIDCKRFTVTLLGREGVEIEKSKLSAGERQIYAIAMLEALARTSGRRLPVVIDTPLGRLDSYHRSNLVEDYFPRVSHQVVLLSTDTEVDENFYRKLSPSVSHAYEICYDERERMAFLKEGYFWRSRMRAAA